MPRFIAALSTAFIFVTGATLTPAAAAADAKTNCKTEVKEYAR